MSVILVEGGRQLFGAVTVQGAKNSVLPMLAAAVLCPGICRLRGCPALSDVDTAARIIRHLGGTIRREGADLVVDARGISRCEIPRELMSRMRSSVMSRRSSTSIISFQRSSGSSVLLCAKFFDFSGVSSR